MRESWIKAIGQEVASSRRALYSSANKYACTRKRFLGIPSWMRPLKTLLHMQAENKFKKFGTAVKNFEEVACILNLLNESKNLEFSSDYVYSAEDGGYYLFGMKGKLNDGQDLRIHRLVRDVAPYPSAKLIVGFLNEQKLPEAEALKFYSKYCEILVAETGMSKPIDTIGWYSKHGFWHPEDYFRRVLSKPNMGRNPQEK